MSDDVRRDGGADEHPLCPMSTDDARRVIAGALRPPGWPRPQTDADANAALHNGGTPAAYVASIYDDNEGGEVAVCSTVEKAVVAGKAELERLRVGRPQYRFDWVAWHIDRWSVDGQPTTVCSAAEPADSGITFRSEGDDE